MHKPKEGDLKVWWIPQVPMKAFEVPVESPKQAKFLLDVLAQYDLFQYHNKVKGDYTNAGGLSVFMNTGDGCEWCDWYSEDGRDIDGHGHAQRRWMI